MPQRGHVRATNNSDHRCIPVHHLHTHENRTQNHGLLDSSSPWQNIQPKSHLMSSCVETNGAVVILVIRRFVQRKAVAKYSTYKLHTEIFGHNFIKQIKFHFLLHCTSALHQHYQSVPGFDVRSDSKVITK